MMIKKIKYLNVLMVLLVLPFSKLCAHSLVLVHIGQEIPEYMRYCMQQIRMFNSCNVYLIASNDALQKFNPALNEFNIIGVPCESLEKSYHHQKFTEAERLENGFWRYTTERFFYIEELARQLQLTDIFHIEYDNMLYVDLETLLPIFQEKYPFIAATFDNDQRCIPGFVYFKNEEALRLLVKFLAKRSLQSKNDMQTLALFKTSEKTKTYIDSLPITLPEYCQYHKLISPHGHLGKIESDYFQNIDAFNSIFDAAALGQYLGGIDPRNANSGPGFINESCVFNPSLFEYQWISDEHGRKIPYIIFMQQKYRINNLHIHSKNLKKFLS